MVKGRVLLTVVAGKPPSEILEVPLPDGGRMTLCPVGNSGYMLNPFVPTVAFSQLSSNMSCPRDCVSRHNGGTSGAPLKPLRDDSVVMSLNKLPPIQT